LGGTSGIGLAVAQAALDEGDVWSGVLGILIAAIIVLMVFKPT